MELSVKIFLGIILLIFAVLDVAVVASLIRPGDERNQIIVWKAGAYTLLVSIGSMMIDVVENFVRAQEMSINPFVHLEITAIIYFIALIYFKKGIVSKMENTIRSIRKELGFSQEELAKKCGVSRQTVNAIENNKYDPTLTLAFNLAKALHTTVNKLFIPF